jgi:hypothetical protein
MERKLDKRNNPTDQLVSQISNLSPFDIQVLQNMVKRMNEAGAVDDSTAITLLSDEENSASETEITDTNPGEIPTYGLRMSPTKASSSRLAEF